MPLSDYNNNPPPDDGSQTAGNEITWAKIKDELTDPLKDGLESRDFNGAEVILDADGDTSITADTDDRVDFKVGGTDSLRLGRYDSGSVTTFFHLNPGAQSAVANDSWAWAQIRTDGGVTIPAGTAAVVATLYLEEPTITATGTATAAATLYIPSAPTEATSNYALWVDAGLTRLDGGVEGVTVTGSYTGDGTTSQAITGLAAQPKELDIWVRETTDGNSVTRIYTTDVINDDHANGGAILTTSAGASTFEADRIVSLDANGFTVDDAGADAHPNKNGTTYNYRVTF